MPAPEFKPGFRLSITDLLVLCVGGAGVVFLAREELWKPAIIAMVVVHFFLFCNVFRIPRALELIWAAAFLVFCGATIQTGRPGWALAFGGSIVLSVALIGWATRSPAYHGICWQRWNPNLPAWWQARHSRE